MRGQSLGSLKHYCTNWNAADSMEDTASSGSSEMPTKPKAIAKEFFKAQQYLFKIAGATTVSNFHSLLNHISPQSPKMSAVRDSVIRDFPHSSFLDIAF
jgi:hypothetical protein